MFETDCVWSENKHLFSLQVGLYHISITKPLQSLDHSICLTVESDIVHSVGWLC